MTDLEQIQIEQDAWEMFAHAHPHEAYELDPDRFWAFFHKKCPHRSREEMEHTLKKTA